MCDESFRKVVERALAPGCCCPGLRALKEGHNRFVRTNDTKAVVGSVDLDGCLKRTYPQDPRWDYVIGCDNRSLVFLEVHPPKVSEIVKKFEWLRCFLDRAGSPLRNWAKKRSYYWKSTTAAPRFGSRSYYRITSKGIKVVSSVVRVKCS